MLLAAVVVQTFAANLTNVYTAGLSLATSFPALGRLRATVAVGLAAVVLSGFPSLIEEAQSWITHLGNLAAPITGVVLADYLVLRRGRLDVPALYAPPAGRTGSWDGSTSSPSWRSRPGRSRTPSYPTRS